MECNISEKEYAKAKKDFSFGEPKDKFTITGVDPEKNYRLTRIDDDVNKYEEAKGSAFIPCVDPKVNLVNSSDKPGTPQILKSHGEKYLLMVRSNRMATIHAMVIKEKGKGLLEAASTAPLQNSKYVGRTGRIELSQIKSGR